MVLVHRAHLDSLDRWGLRCINDSVYLAARPRSSAGKAVNGYFTIFLKSAWGRHIVGAAIALLIVAPLLYMALEREPTFTLLDGALIPSPIKRGEKAQVIWHVKFSGSFCEGKMQREIIDSRRQLWPYVIRDRSARFVADPTNPGYGWIETAPLQLPDGIATGPATYRVTVFWYCNWLQRKLEWPIVVDRPVINFEVLE